MITRRRAARATLLVVVVLLTGYLGVMVYTFTAGATATARVDHCSHFRRSTHCYGSWTGGHTGSGQIVGASTSDVGHELDVRVGPFGAYVDDVATPLLRIGIPGFLDVLVGGIVWATIGRGTRRRRAMLDTRDGALAGTVAAGRLTAADGRVLLADAGGGRVVDAVTGATVLGARVDGPRIWVTGGDGRPVGTVTWAPGVWVWTFADVMGLPLATMRADAASFVRGRGLQVLDSAGRRAAAIVGRGFERLVVRVEPTTGEALRTLVLAFALSAGRIDLRRAGRGPAGSYGSPPLTR